MDTATVMDTAESHQSSGDLVLTSLRQILQADVLEASKAIRDSLVSELRQILQADVLEASKAIRDSLVSELRQILQADIRSYGVSLQEDIQGATCQNFEARLVVLENRADQRVALACQTFDGYLRSFQEALCDLQLSLSTMPTPQVNVNVPPPRLVRKFFTYNEFGQPAEVVEQELQSE